MISQRSYFLLVAIVILLTTILFVPVLPFFSVTANYGDLFSYYYPLKYHLVNGLYQGVIPLWNPYIFSGIPFLANMQTSVFYPWSVLFYVLGLRNSFTLFFIIHYVLAAIGMFLLLKSMRMKTYAACFGALLFAFSGFMIAKIPQGHPVHCSGFALGPLVFLFIRGIVFGNRHMLVLLCAGISIAYQFFTGHIQPLYIVAVCSLIYAVWHWKRFSYVWTVPVIIASGLIAVQLLPTIAYARESLRSLWNIRLAASYSLSWESLLTMVFPGWFGNPFNGTFFDQSHPSVFFEQYSLYIGIIPVITCFIGLYQVIRKKDYIIILLLGFTLIVSLGKTTPLFPFLYQYLPGLNMLRVPARFMYGFLFFLIILSAQGFETMMRLSFMSRIFFSRCFFVILSFIMLYIPLQKYIQKAETDQYLSKTSVSEFFNSIDNPFKFTTDSTINNPNKSMLYHHFNIDGYEALFLKNYVFYINAAHDRPVVSTVRSRINNYHSPLMKLLGQRFFVMLNDGVPRIIEIPDAGRPWYFASVEHGVTDYSRMLAAMKNQNSSMIESVFLLNDTASVNHNAHKNRIVKVDFYKNMFKALVTVHKPSWFVLSDSFTQGWCAYADHKPAQVVRANYLVKAVFVQQPGTYMLYCMYRPLTYRIGLLITFLFVVILIYCVYRKRYDVYNFTSIQ
ncbi:MAG: hypothetical protein GF384_06275 [Elusimicrobia bacterium]|nr:hypothetical protein [Elusimicrobiota bacterium]MBD3412326.1 hypothetical protein [Elusimicrobiota bacterium]